MRITARFLMVTSLLFSFAGAPAGPVQAAAYIVGCSTNELIAALETANASPADDSLSLAAGCFYVLTEVIDNTVGPTGLPAIANAATAGRLTVNGNGATITLGFRIWVPLVSNGDAQAAASSSAAAQAIPGLPEMRLLRVDTGAHLTLTDVTLQNGNLPQQNGGGLYNAGTLTVTHAALTGNLAGQGGGIYNAGTLNVADSTFTNNSAEAGGGINSAGALSVTGSTFEANTAGLGDAVLVADGTVSESGNSYDGETPVTCPPFPYTVPAGDVPALVNALHCANSAPSNDLIHLSNSTYTLSAVDNTAGQDINGLPVVAFAATAGALTLNGHGATIARSSAGGTPDFRLLMSRGTLTLTEMTLRGGFLPTAPGGALANVNGSLTLSDSVVVSNTSGYGGGLFNWQGSLTLIDTQVLSNTSVNDGAGGGLVSHGALEVDGGQFAGNTAAQNGGGLAVLQGTATLADVTIAGNTSINTGGGLFVEAFATATLTGSTLSANEATNGGGGGVRVGGTLTVTDSLITFNTTTDGGGLFNTGGTLTLLETTVTNNTASHGGGGLKIINGSVVISQSALLTNTADGYGGGVLIEAGSLTVVNTMVADNSTGNDGAGINSAGELVVRNSQFVGNYATGLGGGLLVANGTADISDSTFRDNETHGNAGGAGILNGVFSSTMTVSNTTIAYNYADGAGGGVFNGGGGTLTLINTTVAFNLGITGGGVWNGGTLTVLHSTVYSNVASAEGGGFYLPGGTLNLGHTLVAANASNVAVGPDVSGTVNSLGYNLVSDTSHATISGIGTGNLVNGAATPLNLGALQDNGGPTWTMALGAGSVAINAGNPLFSPPPTFDQRGTGFPRVLAGVIDIGAYERSP